MVSLQDEFRPDALLFGETQSRIIVSVKDEHLSMFLNLAQEREVRVAVIGKTGGERLIVEHLGQKLIDTPVKEAFWAWKQAIPERFKII